MTKEEARIIAEEKCEDFMTAEFGCRLVSDNEDPLQGYLQGQNTYSQAGEVFSVKCVGIGNTDISHYREGWECEKLTDKEVIHACCNGGDMEDEIQGLADAIYASANERRY